MLGRCVVRRRGAQIRKSVGADKSLRKWVKDEQSREVTYITLIHPKSFIDERLETDYSRSILEIEEHIFQIIVE